MEPRQFVYLDTGAVRSLLASHSIAAPDEIRETKNRLQKAGKKLGLMSGFLFPDSVVQISREIYLIVRLERVYLSRTEK